MLKLAELFQNGMTLQRQKPIRIWGSSDCAQNLTVSLNGETLLRDAPVDGEFCLTLPPQEAMRDAELRIAGTVDTLTLSRVDIGEVWIAGGQSNMEFLLRYDAEGKEQIRSANDPHLRFYDVGEYTFPVKRSRRIRITARAGIVGWLFSRTQRNTSPPWACISQSSSARHTMCRLPL